MSSSELDTLQKACPYREHALISRQEHEAWEVLLACQGQLRQIVEPDGIARRYVLGLFHASRAMPERACEQARYPPAAVGCGAAVTGGFHDQLPRGPVPG